MHIARWHLEWKVHLILCAHNCRHLVVIRIITIAHAIVATLSKIMRPIAGEMMRKLFGHHLIRQPRMRMTESFHKLDWRFREIRIQRIFHHSKLAVVRRIRAFFVWNIFAV